MQILISEVPHKKQRKQQPNENEKQEKESDGIENVEKEEKEKEEEEEVEEEDLDFWGETLFPFILSTHSTFFFLPPKTGPGPYATHEQTKIWIEKVYKEEGVDFRHILNIWGEELNGDVFYGFRHKVDYELVHVYKVNKRDIQVMRSKLEQDEAKIEAQHVKKLMKERAFRQVDREGLYLWGIFFFFFEFFDLTIDF